MRRSQVVFHRGGIRRETPNISEVNSKRGGAVARGLVVSGANKVVGPVHSQIPTTAGPYPGDCTRPNKPGTGGNAIVLYCHYFFKFQKDEESSVKNNDEKRGSMR